MKVLLLVTFSLLASHVLADDEARGDRRCRCGAGSAVKKRTAVREGGRAHRQGDRRRRGGRGGGARMKRLLERFDANGDGSLSEEELAAAGKAVKQRRRGRRASQGHRETSEIREMHRGPRGGRGLRGRQDGFKRRGLHDRRPGIDRRARRHRDEEHAGKAGRRRRGESDRSGEPAPARGDLLGRFDADGDGALSPDEKAAARDALLEDLKAVLE